MEAVKKQTLAIVLDKLEHLDPEAEDFNPEEAVGDVKDKIDAIKYRLNEWAARAKMIDEDWLLPLAARKKAILSSHGRLEAYLSTQMAVRGFETLPGHAFRVDLVNSTPAVVVVCEPNGDALNEFGWAVKTNYSWDKAKLKEALQAGVQLSFAELKQGKHLRFYPKKGS